jgi:hypothetical protein
MGDPEMTKPLCLYCLSKNALRPRPVGTGSRPRGRTEANDAIAYHLCLPHLHSLQRRRWTSNEYWASSPSDGVQRLLWNLRTVTYDEALDRLVRIGAVKRPDPPDSTVATRQ